MSKILVVGASGTVGTELVTLLRKEGYTVRSTTSKPVNSPSVDLVHVNLANGEGIRDAFEGVDKAFLLSPPGYADQHATLSPLIQEAKRRGLKHVVLMTAMGANANDASPFRKAEKELEASGLSYNIIRPNWFLQNFNTFWLHGIKAEGKIQLPAGNAKVSFIDARDIAAVAARLLTSDQHKDRAFDLTGPSAVDHTDVASALSAVSGKTITYVDVSPEALRAGLLSAGLPKDYVDFLILIFGFLKEGYSARVTNDVQMITGKSPRGLTAYAKDYASSF